MDSQNEKSHGWIWLVLLALVLTAGLGTALYFARDLSFIKSSSSAASNTSTSSVADSSSKGSTSQGASSVSTSPNVVDSPTITVNKAAVKFNLSSSDTTYPTDSFQAALSGLPTGAGTTEKQMYIYCDDDALDSWVELSVKNAGSYTKLSKPYNFQSGETIYVHPLKLPGLTNEYWYKLPLWMKSSSYPDLEGLVEIFVYNVTD